MAKKKKYIVAIRQGSDVVLVETDNPSKAIKGLEQDHLDNVSDENKDKSVSVEIYDGDEDPAKIKSVNPDDRPTTIAPSASGKNVRLALRSAGGGDSNDTADLMAGYLKRYNVDDSGADSDQDGKYKYTIEIDGQIFEGHDNDPQKAYEKARKKAQEELGENALRTKKTKVTIENTEKDESVSASGKNLGEAVLSAHESTKEDDESKLKSETSRVLGSESKRFYQYVIEVGGETYIGIAYKFKDLPKAQKNAQDKLENGEAGTGTAKIIEDDERVKVRIIDGEGKVMEGEGRTETIAVSELSESCKDALNGSQRQTVGTLKSNASGPGRGMVKVAWALVKYGMPLAEGFAAGFAAKMAIAGALTAAKMLGVGAAALAGWPLLVIGLGVALAVGMLAAKYFPKAAIGLMGIFNKKAFGLNAQEYQKHMQNTNGFGKAVIMLSRLAGLVLGGGLTPYQGDLPFGGGEPSGTESNGLVDAQPDFTTLDAPQDLGEVVEGSAVESGDYKAYDLVNPDGSSNGYINNGNGYWEHVAADGTTTNYPPDYTFDPATGEMRPPEASGPSGGMANNNEVSRPSAPTPA